MAQRRAPDRRTPAVMGWFVYLLECRNGSIYTGIARDVAARYAQHLAGTGARFTRANPPLRLLAQFACDDRSTATRAEAALKRLAPSAKRALCGQGDDTLARHGLRRCPPPD
jgi:putative endonuclease